MSGSSRKVNYPALQREYITSNEDLSLRKMAAEVGISNSTLSDYARKHGWKKKRAQYLATVDEEFIQQSAHARARKLAELAERSVDVLEGMLVRAAQQLNPPKDEETGEQMFKPLELAPRDVLDVIRQIAVARGDPSDITGEQNVTVHTVDPRLIRALGVLAGRALTGGAGPGGPARGEDLIALPGPEERAG